MEDVYNVFRVANFAWAFLLFFGLIYWGLQDIILSRRCGHIQVPPEHYFFATACLVACFVFLVILGEVFLKDPEIILGSIFPALFLLPATIACSQGAFRIRMHREMIRKGLC